MTVAQRINYFTSKKSLVESEFEQYGLDEIDSTARAMFENFHREELLELRETKNKEAENLIGNQDEASVPATTTTSDDLTVSWKIDNLTSTTVAKSAAINKAGNSRISKANKMPERKGKNRKSEGGVSESEKETSQLNSNRGRKRARESEVSTPRSTPRSSLSPSIRNVSEKPTPKASRKRRNPGVISDLTEESDLESQTDRGQ